MPDDNKQILASSEFDPSQYIQGIDNMIASLGKLTQKEDEVKARLDQINKALTENKAANKAADDALKQLDKTSEDYHTNLFLVTSRQSELAAQQKDLQRELKITKGTLQEIAGSTSTYKAALENLRATAQKMKGAGGTIFDAASLNQQVAKVTAVASTFRNIFKGKVDTSALDELEDKLAGTGDEFERLREIIDFIKPKLENLDPNSQEFKDLSDVVATGSKVLEEFGDMQDKLDKRTPSLTTRLRQLRNVLAEMKKDGKDNTEEFRALEEEAVHLQDAIDKTGERVRTFANDTRLIGFGIEAIRGVAAGFELAEGASALFGVKNEAVEESIKRLNAIMAIANGLQEVSNLLKKESVLRLVGEEIATKAYTLSQRILAATLGTTAAASRGLAIALAATGIGALVLGIGILLHVMTSWTSATKEQTEAQENLNISIEVGTKDNEIFIAGILEAGRVLAAQAELRQALNDKAGESDQAQLERRARNAEELRNIELKNLEEAIVQAKAFEESRVAAGVEAEEKLRQIANKEISYNEDYVKSLEKTVEETAKATDTRIELENQLELKTLQAQRDAARSRVEIDNARIKREEDFIKRLEELRKRLLDAQNRAARQDAQQLGKQAQDQLNFELKAIDREVKKGQLTSSQGRILKDLIKKVNDTELTTELKEFGKKSRDAQQSIEDEIFELRLTSAENRANLLRDALEKEAALIEVTSRREFEALEKQRTEQLEGVREAFDQGLISEGQAQRNSDRIKVIYGKLFDDLAEQTRRKQEELANLAFQRSQELVQQLFAPTFVGLSEAATREIQALTRRFVNNRITYEQYQIALTDITRRESQKRIDVQLVEARELLAGVQRRLQLEQDPQRRKELEARILELRQQISDLQRQAAEGEAANEKAADDAFGRKVQRVAAYVQAIGNLVSAVVQFWAQANQAEQRQLDRSIAIQEKRVDAATKIAERGNAEYLRLEEDRLNELRIKQENAARRQLAVNAVLQASQALVAFTTALAQGIATGGPLGGIAIATAVLGLLAAGYAIVQSLQDRAPQELWEGTPYLEGTGHPGGRDTIPAKLTRGEAVLPVDMNQAYHPTVRAMFEGDVPPAALNAFVDRYRVNARTLPVMAHERIGEAAEVASTYNGQLLVVAQAQAASLQENTELLREVKHHFKHLNINMNVDRRGLALSVVTAIDHEKKQSKA